MNGSNTQPDNIGLAEKDFLYSVLNLPTSASEHDIRERYRALSIIFHPDKQHGDESSKATAEKRFLEIQKAYEVLSDPFLREVYSIFGHEGLSLKWSDTLRSRPPDELRNLLRRLKRDYDRDKLEGEVRPRGKLTCALDVSRVLREEDDHSLQANDWYQRIARRMWQARVLSTTISHDVTHALNDKTRVRLGAQCATAMVEVEGSRINVGGSEIFGTIRHQYNPRWVFIATTALLHPRSVTLKTTFQDDDMECTVQAHLSTSGRVLPPMTVSTSRRLFSKSPTEGVLTVYTGPHPSLTMSLIVPSAFDASVDTYGPRPGSASGLSIGSTYRSYSLVLSGLNTALKAEWCLAFSELAIQLKLAVEHGLFTGLGFSITGAWSQDRVEVATSVGLNQYGVHLRLDLGYVGQRLSIPIALSQEHDTGLALWTAVLPSTAFVLGYHFILKPRRRAQRAAYFQAARKAMEDDKYHVKREFEETAALLKETAKKHMQAETSKGGLVILEATYGPTDQDENARELMFDVTVPIQALVYHSQIYVPGHRTKSGIQGFYDPAPGCAKVLRVRYSFRGRGHYAEVPDHMPVVLPLADHLVEVWVLLFAIDA